MVLNSCAGRALEETSKELGLQRHLSWWEGTGNWCKVRKVFTSFYSSFRVTSKLLQISPSFFSQSFILLSRKEFVLVDIHSNLDSNPRVPRITWTLSYKPECEFWATDSLDLIQLHSKPKWDLQSHPRYLEIIVIRYSLAFVSALLLELALQLDQERHLVYLCHVWKMLLIHAGCTGTMQ